jgi:group I intron endonuclease
METNYIYKITNKVNGKVYIGKTKDPERRWREHKNESLKAEKKYVIYLALNKYGINNFDFEVIEECGAN